MGLSRGKKKCSLPEARKRGKAAQPSSGNERRPGPLGSLSILPHISHFTLLRFSAMEGGSHFTEEAMLGVCGGRVDGLIEARFPINAEKAKRHKKEAQCCRRHWLPF